MKSRLETSRTWMRPFELSDAPEAFSWFGDPEVMRFIPYGADHAEEETDTRLGRYIDHQNRHGFSKWVIIDKQSGKLMGDSGFYRLPDGKRIELGYRLARDFWGQGFAMEVARKWIELAGHFIREPTIFAFADPRNAASLHVMDKLGFKYIRDETLYGLTEPLYGLDYNSKLVH